MTGGISNKILSCWNKSKNPNDRILLRIFGEKTDLIIDRCEINIKTAKF